MPQSITTSIHDEDPRLLVIQRGAEKRTFRIVPSEPDRFTVTDPKGVDYRVWIDYTHDDHDLWRCSNGATWMVSRPGFEVVMTGECAPISAVVDWMICRSMQKMALLPVPSFEDLARMDADFAQQMARLSAPDTSAAQGFMARWNGQRINRR